MRSAISLSCYGTKGELLLAERPLKHVEHDLQAIHPNGAAADRAEMLDSVDGGPAAPRERHVDEALLMVFAGGSGEARHSERNVRVRAGEGALGHRPRDDFGNRFVL